MRVLHRIQEIKVGLDFGEEILPVGRLALRDQTIYFEYQPSFIRRGLEISPLKLPLRPGLFAFEYFLFEGLPGVFMDSLPDGWGRLLVDRFMRSKGIPPAEITPLDRLAYVGSRGMGALVYEPDLSHLDTNGKIHMDQLADLVEEVLTDHSQEALQDLLTLNGASAGARLKALNGVDENRQYITHGVNELPEGYTHWLGKFTTTHDGPDAGALEYV